MGAILLSIAIVTRNRPDSLERTLKSLSLQRPLPYEVIISDDSNSEEMIRQNKEVVGKYGYKHIVGLMKGLYVNRNFVAKQCTGTHIRTMDDDHEFPERHMQACMDAITSNPEIIWTIGEYHPWDKQRPIPVMERIPGQLDPRGFAYAPKDMNNYYGISCGASIYPRSVITRKIMNLETYNFGMLFLEYGVRLHKNGFKIRHLNTTYVLHHAEQNDATMVSSQIIMSAKLFCMFMFSFKHYPTIKNKLLTINQILREVLSKNCSFKLVGDAYRNYERESHRIC